MKSDTDQPTAADAVGAADATAAPSGKKTAQDRRDEITHAQVAAENVLLEFLPTGERMTLRKTQWELLTADDLLPSPDQTLRVPPSAFRVVTPE